MRDEQIRCVFVHLAADKRVVEQRLEKRGSGEPVVSDARADDLAVLDAGFEEPVAREKLPLIEIRSENGVDATLTGILKGLVSASVEEYRSSSVDLGPSQRSG